MATDSQSNVNEKSRLEPTRRIALWAILAIVVAAIVALSVLWLGGNEDEWFSLTQVEGGIKCTVSDDSYGHAYGVEIDNGLAHVYWGIEGAQTPTGSWTATPLEVQSLGGILLRLTSIDVKGDGEISPGDYIVATAVNSTHFPVDVTHNFTLMYGALAISGWDVRTSFSFHGGEMIVGETTVSVMPY